MYPDQGQVKQRQHELLSRAYQERQACQLAALRRASRRAERAERRLTVALTAVMRARAELTPNS